MSMKEFRLFDFKFVDAKQLTEESSDSDNYDNASDTSFKMNTKFTIQLFGINEEGQSVLINVDDFKPFFFVKVNNNWTSKEKNLFISEIKSKVKSIQDDIIDYKLLHRKKLYEFDDYKDHVFLQITFENLNAMNKVKYLFPNKYFQYTKRFFGSIIFSCI